MSDILAGEIVERPHETAKWGYMGEWREFQAGFRMYRVRMARADDGSWEKAVVEHETRNGWAHVGKKVGEGIDIGRALERMGIPDDHWDWRDGKRPPTPESDTPPAAPEPSEEKTGSTLGAQEGTRG